MGTDHLPDASLHRYHYNAGNDLSSTGLLCDLARGKEALSANIYNVNSQAGNRILLQSLWWPREGGPLLTAEAVERLGPYITRYAQTLGIAIFAVGGTEDHLHIAHDLVPSRPLTGSMEEIRRATVRFLRDSLNIPNFTWAEDTTLVSARPEDLESLSAYIRENAARHAAGRTLPEWEGTDGDAEPEETDEMPDWLKRAAAKAGD